MPDTLIIETENDIDVVRFKDPSMLDVLAIQRIGTDLSALVQTTSGTKILLNFDGIRFLSSEALRVLIGLRAKADKVSRKIALCSIRPDLLRVFQLTNLDKLFTIFPDVETAKARLA